jgi:hypothetical protein
MCRSFVSAMSITRICDLGHSSEMNVASKRLTWASCPAMVRSPRLPKGFVSKLAPGGIEPPKFSATVWPVSSLVCRTARVTPARGPEACTRMGTLFAGVVGGGIDEVEAVVSGNQIVIGGWRRSLSRRAATRVTPATFFASELQSPRMKPQALPRRLSSSQARVTMGLYVTTATANIVPQEPSSSLERVVDSPMKILMLTL